MEELLGRVISVLKGVWKFRWPGIAIAWVISVVGVVVVISVPDKYEASARVFVDTQSILKPLMAGLAVQPNVEQQITMLSRTLISRPNVEKLIRMADLDLGSNNRADRDALIDRVTRGLEIRNAGRDNLYTLAYRDESPDRARRVVQALVSIFVESSLGASRKDSDSAKKFIEEQIKVHVTKLEEAETRLKEFRLKNIDMQTSQGREVTWSFGDVSNQLNQARLELKEAENAREEARKQLDAEKSQTANITTRSILQESAIQVSTPEIDARISSQKQSLDGLLQRFTDQHPDVVNTRRLLKDLEEQKRKEVAELRKVAMANPPPAAQGSGPSLVVQDLGRMLAASEVQVASLKARVGEYESRMARARTQMKVAPQIEAEFAQLNREYDIHKRNYEGLVQRREQAGMSGELEDAAGVVDFRLIDPPRASPKPVAPNRLLLMPVVFLAGLGAGLGMAFVLSQLRAVFFDARAVLNTIGLPILGVVTLVRTDASRLRDRRELRLFGLASGGLIGFFGVAIVVLTFLAQRAG
jgi:polysaccharide chain length determinant protein (PEP-CTERM system associated)